MRTHTPRKIPNAVLLSAAQRVLSESVANADDSVDWAATADELASLTLAVQAAAASGEAGVNGGSDSKLSQRLIALLEAEVQKAEGTVPSEEPLAEALSIDGTLTALRRVRSIVDATHDSSPEPGLAAPDGLELVSEIAHDLRSPLTAILTLAEAVRRGQSGEVNEVQRRQLGLIYSAALALSATASDLIELAHGGDRLAQKEPSVFSVTEILESVRDMVYPMAEEKDVSLRCATDITYSSLGYPLALRRVLLNLTTNALKFTEEGFVEIHVRQLGRMRAEFSVRDTGKGIEPDRLPTLYNPFRRRPRTCGYLFSGTGLGLAICRRLVEAMDSELRLESRPGSGTRFYFELLLPRADEMALS